MFPTERASMSQSAIQAFPDPLRIPTTSIPMNTAVRTTALMHAFIPGASPPEVKTPLYFFLFLTNLIMNNIQYSVYFLH